MPRFTDWTDEELEYEVESVADWLRSDYPRIVHDDQTARRAREAREDLRDMVAELAVRDRGGL